MRWLTSLVFLTASFAPVADAGATWSVVAIDRDTGTVVIASATCVAQARFQSFPADGLMDIQAIVVPGLGVAAAQAGVDRTRANQSLIADELSKATPPRDIITMLERDPDIARRQFGIVDIEGRRAGYSGESNGQASLDVQGDVSGTEIVYSIQGNILASDDVVDDAAKALESTEGSLTDRVMAAMEAADAAGGDSRCTCESEPRTSAPCDGKTSHVAYILAADSGASRDEPTLYINVTDENIESHENANPVKTLRLRYDARER